MAVKYWADRIAEAQAALSKKNILQIEKQLTKYYRQSAAKVIEDFQATYDKLLATELDGREPTPADLYKLDKYWKMQGQLREELRKLGEKQIAALTKQFEIQFFDIYYSIALEGKAAYSTIDTAAAMQMINGIWVADGKSWSERIWQNTEKLAETLNEELIHCVVTGKKTTELKNLLQESFGVSYSRADALVRTEIAHIQTQAAKQRYEDYGVQEVEVWADKDERRCDVCGKLHQKRYPVGAQMPVPAHPRCRCCIIPVVNDKPKSTEPEKRDRVRRIEDRRKVEQKVDFSTMTNKDIQEWSKENLKTKIDYKGATNEASQAATELLLELEKKGFDFGETKVVFSGTSGNYGHYNPKTKTLHLRPNTNFIERMQEEDIRAMYKLKKPQHAVSSYKGSMAHELGHAIDDISGLSLSGTIAKSDDLYIKAVKISNYAGTGGALGTNRANEAFAENFSAYVEGKEVPKEIKELIEEFLKKQKSKKLIL
jgi:SPP1 gp7 family putative phage head morphogenesis protein